MEAATPLIACPPLVDASLTPFIPSKMHPNDRPIEQYALIGDCATAALINADGGIDWLCLPAFDGPSFFGALLDRENGGDFVIRPGMPYRVERGYLDDSALFRTRFLTDAGTVLLTDFFVTARCHRARGYDFTTLAPTRKLVRLVELESGGAVPMEMLVRARPDYGRASADWKRAANGGFTCEEAAFFTNIGAAWRGQDLAGEWNAKPGQCYFAVLDYGKDPPVPDIAAIRSWRKTTTTFWKHWNYFNHYRGSHQRTIRRSAVTLKLLTYAPTGAFVAAPTTSLPEVPGGDSNWDYRYAWVRDTSLFINTLFRLGYSGEATAFLEFAVRESMKRTEAGQTVLPVLFGIREDSKAEPEDLGHLAGWKASRPVRIGNRAADQFQLDNYAHILEALYFFKVTGGKINGDKMNLVRQITEDLVKRWREPDNGVWEEVEKSQFAYGKVAAWAALMRAGKLADLADLPIEETCADIRAEVLTRAVRLRDGGQHMVSRFDSDDIDASCLTAFLNGFLPLPIARATRERVESELASGPFVYRNPKLKDSGEASFLLCMFWRIDHLVKEGEQARAEELLKEVCGMQNEFGLLAEEIEPESRAFIGNFPQAFSHLGLIGSILNVEQARANPKRHALADHEKFTQSVGATVGVRASLAGFIRAPKTLRLLFHSGGSKWKG